MVPWWAVVAAALTPVVLTAGWLIAGVMQPPPYSPVRDTVSSLAGLGGTDRWIMTDAMLLVGGTHLVTAVGLACIRPAARALLLVAGLCSAGIAAAPEPAAGPTPLHLVWAVLGAVTLAVWPLVAGWRLPPNATAFSPRLCALVTLGFAAMLGWVALEVHGGDTLGLAERTVASVQTCWPLVVALLLRRRAAGGSIGRPETSSRVDASV